MPLADLRPQATRRDSQEMVKHLKRFSVPMKFSAGVWFFSPGGGRFHDRYIPAMDLNEKLDIFARLRPHGLTGLEAHYPNEINEENIDQYRKFSKATGIRVLTVIPNLFYEGDFEFGSLSNPIPKIRRKAVERVKTSLQMNKDLDTDFAVMWPGIDGYENCFGHDYYGARDRFLDGVVEALDAVPGVRIAFEPKPYEPRGHILFGTTFEGILLGRKVEARLKNKANQRFLKQGHALFALNPEVGHMIMGTEDVPNAFSLVLEEARLAHSHWNSQPLGNYDQDLNVGVISPEQAEAGIYVLKAHGYTGYFGIDINPERMGVDRALINSMDALKAMNDRVDALDHEKIVACADRPDRNRGYLEALLIRARARSAKGLSPMPAFEK